MNALQKKKYNYNRPIQFQVWQTHSYRIQTLLLQE